MSGVKPPAVPSAHPAQRSGENLRVTYAMRLRIALPTRVFVRMIRYFFL